MLKRYITALTDDTELARHRRALGRTWDERVALVCPGIEDNLGDLAIHDATVALTEGLGVRLERVPYITRERRLARLGLSGSRYFRGVLIGGGTLINDYWLDQAEAWGELVAHAWTFGTGVGSSGFSQHSQVALDPRWASLLSRFAGVGVRGPLSMSRLHDAGVEQAEVVGDAALGLVRSHGALAPVGAHDWFLVNVAGAPQAGHREVADSIDIAAAAAREFAASGLRPLPIAFTPWDAEPTNEVMRRIGSRECVRTPLTLPQLMALLAECVTGVSVRLHGGILAATAGAPTLLFAYRDKAWDYLASMDAGRLGLDASVSPDAAAERARDLLADLEPMRAHTLERAEHWAQVQEDYARRTFAGALEPAAR
ncbi:polysaccharide pyruvyl transferase family protein [Demequina rhizosphaerae]|uniref:polysaccharide pyruvyl transferase family protein n=1 Tax=Demequina rhizosphaerae TaxID=1638985 RepID=UPI0007831D06|nr:polysaccharide pyruvyl transferase family protein [Demequina rhizosphaerae]